MITWLLVAVAVPPVADRCIEANERAQIARAAGRFVDARERFLECARPECPVVIRRDCDVGLAEVRPLIPSVAIAVVDEDQRDVVDAEVVIDGRVIATRIDGKPIELEAGTHELTVRVGERSLSRRVVLLSGERARTVRFELPAITVSAEPEASARPLPIAVTAVSGAALVSFAVLGAVGLSKRSTLADSPCAQSRTCTADDTRTVRTLFLAADVSLVVGVLAGVGAATLWVLD